MKTLLIVSTASPEVLRAANRLGLRVLLMYDDKLTCDDDLIHHQIWCDPHDIKSVQETLLQLEPLKPIHGILTTDERAVLTGAKLAEALGLPSHPYSAVYAARNKFEMRRRLTESRIPCPRFGIARTLAEAEHLASERVRFPLVLKPLFGMVSQGVVRANDDKELKEWFPEVKRIAGLHGYFVKNDPYRDFILMEEYMKGEEISLDGIASRNQIQWVDIFDKPNPLEGPTFEETILVTPSNKPPEVREAVLAMVEQSARALGLCHGPIHAELRLTASGPRILEIAARPIGGMCGTAYNYCIGSDYYEIVVRNALGDPVTVPTSTRTPAGVMMVPVPKAGRYIGVNGVEQARSLPGIENVTIVAKPGQILHGFPEQGWYMGFILAKGSSQDEVVRSLNDAHSRLKFDIDEGKARSL
jgi:biotin carboxylase